MFIASTRLWCLVICFGFGLAVFDLVGYGIDRLRSFWFCFFVCVLYCFLWGCYLVTVVVLVLRMVVVEGLVF